RAALRALEKMGVEVRTQARVTDCAADGVTVSGEHLAAATVLWAAGVAAAPAARWLHALSDPAGRALVDPDLSLPEHPQVFVIGDSAAVLRKDQPVPGIAPAAKQEGAYVAKLIRRVLDGKPRPPPF